MAFYRDVTENVFDQMIKSENTLLAFHAPWCRRCATEGDLQPIAEKYKKMAVGLADWDVNGELLERFRKSGYEVEGLPRILLFKKDAEFVAMEIGRMSTSMIERFLERHFVTP